KLLQDGIPLSLADGGGDFQAIEPLALRYTEVYRGANALQYGATTLGGAINFVSPSGYDAPTYQARFEAGSFGYARGQISTGGIVGDADYFLSLSALRQAGFRDFSKQKNKRLFGNVGYRLRPRIETRFFLTALETDSELPGNLTKAQLNSNPRQANALSQFRNSKRDFPLYRIANRTTFLIQDNWQLDVGLFYSYKDMFHPITPFRIEQRSEDYGADIRLRHDGELFGRRNIFTFGISPVRGDTDDKRFDQINFATPFAPTNGALFTQNQLTATNLDIYAENQHYVLDDLALITGIQVSRANRKLEDRFTPGAAGNSFDETYYGLSPKIGLRYELTDRIQFFGNVSRSFEPPSFGELSGAQRINVLDEQTATTFEIGTRGDTDTMRWDLAYYRAWVKDEFLSLNDASGNALGTISADETLHQGIEAGFYIDLFERLELRQTYLWNDFRFRDDAVFGNNQLAGVPEHVYRAELVYHTPSGYYIGPNVEWVPGDSPVDHANTLFAESYAIVGLKAGYRRASGISVFIEGRNLADKKYAATTGVITNA
ncbi:MAG: TonB-dependent receptor, partial [Pseudomonadales bacterium]